MMRDLTCLFQQPQTFQASLVKRNEWILVRMLYSIVLLFICAQNSFVEMRGNKLCNQCDAATAYFPTVAPCGEFLFKCNSGRLL